MGKTDIADILFYVSLILIVIFSVFFLFKAAETNSPNERIIKDIKLCEEAGLEAYQDELGSITCKIKTYENR